MRTASTLARRDDSRRRRRDDGDVGDVGVRRLSASSCGAARRPATGDGVQLGRARCLRTLVEVAARRAPRHDVRAVPARRRARLRLDVRSRRIVELRAPYGYVWYPTRGRRHGSRTTTDAGATRDVRLELRRRRRPWGCPTHHYGRWGLSSAGAWFWIPSAGWGAAWVNWAVAPGYVGWCPLGGTTARGGFWGHGTVTRTGGRDADATVASARSVIPTDGGRVSTHAIDVRRSRPAGTQLRRAADAAVGGDPRGSVAPGPHGRPVGGAARRPTAARSAAGGSARSLARCADVRIASPSSRTAPGSTRAAVRRSRDLSPRHAHRVRAGSSGPVRMRGRRGGDHGDFPRTGALPGPAGADSSRYGRPTHGLAIPRHRPRRTRAGERTPATRPPRALGRSSRLRGAARRRPSQRVRTIRAPGSRPGSARRRQSRSGRGHAIGDADRSARRHLRTPRRRPQPASGAGASGAPRARSRRGAAQRQPTLGHLSA